MRCTLILALNIVLLPAAASAISMAYTNQAAFLADLPGPAQTLDFESIPVGQLIPDGSSVDGIGFHYAIHGLSMQVVDDFDASSGSRSLGLDDPGNFNQFLDGDAFELSFAPSFALGMFFITSDPLELGDITIQTSAGSAGNALAPDHVLPDGGQAYFLGLIADEAFSDAQIVFADDGYHIHFLFNVDDIVVTPEPNLNWLLAGILIAWGSIRIRRR